MVPLVAAGLISAAGSVFNSAVNSVSASAQSRSQYHMNRKLMKEQAQLNHDLWHENNEYNTPKAQMERYRDAGLNPNLIYGQGDNGNSTSPAKSFDAIETAAAPGYRMPSNLWNDAADMYLRSAQLKGDLKYKEALTSNLETQEALTRQHIINAAFQNDMNSDLKPWLKEQTISNVMESWKRRDKADSDITFNQAKINQIQTQLKLDSAKTLEVYQKIRQISVQIALDMERINTEKSKQAANYGLVERYGYLNEQTTADIFNTRARTTGQYLENLFNEDTFNSRVNTITNIATESLYRSHNNRIEFNINNIRQQLMLKYGTEKIPSNLYQLLYIANGNDWTPWEQPIQR